MTQISFKIGTTPAPVELNITYMGIDIFSMPKTQLLKLIDRLAIVELIPTNKENPTILDVLLAASNYIQGGYEFPYMTIENYNNSDSRLVKKCFFVLN